MVQVHQTDFPGVLLLEPTVFDDERGYLCELQRAGRFAAPDLPSSFGQSTLSVSHRGVIRGLHYQLPHPQGKLICVLAGAIFDVVVDVRQDSPTFGHHLTWTLADRPVRLLWVPPGYAHGFQALTSEARVLYLTTTAYDPEGQHTIRWDDPALAIPWPLERPLLSPRDAAAPLLREKVAVELPWYAPVDPSHRDGV